MRIMEMVGFKRRLGQTFIFLIVFVACQPDSDILNSIDTQNVNSESASSALISENSDISTKLISSITRTQYAGARTVSETLLPNDQRLTGATVTLERTGTISAPAGQIIIDFETGKTDN